MVLPYPEHSPFTDSSRGLEDSSFKRVLPPLENGEENYSKFYENKFTFPQNNKLLHKISDVCSMEVDHAESDVCIVPPQVEADLKVNKQESYCETSSKSDVDFKALQFNCIEKKEESQSMDLDECSPTSHIDPFDTCSRDLRVECLQSLESLEKMCKKEGLKFNDCPEDDAAYEVDMIFAHKIINKKTLYHIKWKNYSTEQNTWEPASNLSGCKESIGYYRAMQGSKPNVNKDLLSYFVKDLISRKPYDILTMNKACAVCFGASEKYVQSLNLTVSQMKVKIKEILNFSPKKLIRLQTVLFEIMRFGEARKQVLINLKEWQSEINSENKTAYIEVENNVDLETAPTGFKFIQDYVNSVATMPEEPVTFCHCNNCFQEKGNCCPEDSEGHFAYNRYQRLILRPGYPIFECNRKCHCDSNCINRLVQHGQKVKVAIFRTSNGCGWGLKTLETIEKGQFVLEYLGEIITSEAAEARGRIYDYIGRSYLFDLDYGVDNSSCCYTVDAGHLGNASHFINHSCDPNLHVFAVWINQPDPNLPRLSFFARRKINRGEELTFDYKMEQNHRFDNQKSAEHHERILCKCKSRNCRKFLF